MKKNITRLIVGASVAGAAMGVIAAPMAIADPPYANCAAARADGAAPIQKGDPGYKDQLDRDGDGIACE